MRSILNFDFKSKNQTKLILHGLVWLMFFSIPLYSIFFSSKAYNFGFLATIFSSIFVFYSNFSFLVPKYMMTKNWKIYFVLLSVLFLLHYCVFLNSEPLMPDNGNFNHIHHDKLPPPNFNDDPFFRLFPAILLFILMISVSSFLKIYEIWNENYKKKKEIENENRITELNFLKAQLNPHFFFNSLNTIYSLSISKSSKTSDAILNLSELMRYMLSDKKDKGIEQKVKLAEEIDYINNYIELQKLRITPNNVIEFSIEGDIENIEIFPLLFISFIENAFKFGVHPVDKNHIKISFKFENDFLEFSATNPIHFQKNSYDSFGLGNQNSLRRLNLYYPKNELKVESIENYYKVHLKINVNEN